MILKVHHSMTDGVGGMKLLLMLFDFERRPGAGRPALDRVDAVPIYDADGPRARARSGTTSGACSASPRRSVIESVGATRTRARRPGRRRRSEALRAAGSVVRFLTPATDPPLTDPARPDAGPAARARSTCRSTTLKRAAQDRRRVAERRVRRRGARRDAAVPRVPRREPSTSCAWSCRSTCAANDSALGGNHFTPARFLVPLTIKDPSERIVAVGRLTREIRDEPAVQLTEALAGVLNQLPTTITTALFGSMLKGADFVTSNVPGAPFPIYSGGAALERMYAFAPLAGAAVNVTLLSNCGTCCIGVNVDSVAVPDSDVFLPTSKKASPRSSPSPEPGSARSITARNSSNRETSAGRPSDAAGPVVPWIRGRRPGRGGRSGRRAARAGRRSGDGSSSGSSASGRSACSGARRRRTGWSGGRADRRQGRDRALGVPPDRPLPHLHGHRRAPGEEQGRRTG